MFKSTINILNIIKKYRSYSYYNNRDNGYNVYTTDKGRKDEILIREASPEQVYNKIKPKYLVTYNSKKELIKEWK
jgi:hypothetical protein